MLRPRACRWFELITSRDDLAAALESLAGTGAVELQTHERGGGALVIAGAEPALERFHELAKTCQGHWPTPHKATSARIADPARTLGARLAQLEAWRSDADPLLAERERLAALQRHWADLAHVLAADPARLPSPSLLAASGRFMVEVRLYAVVRRGPASELPADVLQLTLPAAGDEDFVVLAGHRQDMAAVDEVFAARKARRIVWPDELDGDLPQATRRVGERRAALDARRVQIEDELEALSQRHELPAALGDIAVIEWLTRHGAELAATERLVWVTGWTTTPDAAAFCAPLEARTLPCVVQFGAPPAGAEPPSLLSNPPWARAFEAFARLLGQPGRDEADPSPLVALIAPLLFGFMFGDIGQGAVLLAAGWLLRRRFPMLVLLIPGGAMAMLFGWLFGTVFAREDLVPPLWLHPLHEPVTLLAAAVGLGVAILLGGLTLNALQAHWRGDAAAWWARDAGLVLAYVALLAAVFEPAALWFALAAAVWFAAGSVWTTTGARAAALVAGLAQFVEGILQLLVNTVSFARVGAFALAHAGLSVAVTGVAEASGAVGYWIVLALGNVLILVLEGLVVGIQTTRLLLFEFFVRFLKGTGRVFRPLPPPLLQTTPPTGSTS
jgi:V/A-type H+-transporting ATPase subunit I